MYALVSVATYVCLGVNSPQYSVRNAKMRAKEEVRSNPLPFRHAMRGHQLASTNKSRACRGRGLDPQDV